MHTNDCHSYCISRCMGSSYWNMCFFTYNERTAYLFVYIMWYLRHHWCIFWMEPVQLVGNVKIQRQHISHQLTIGHIAHNWVWLTSSYPSNRFTHWVLNDYSIFCQFSLQFSLVHSFFMNKWYLLLFTFSCQKVNEGKASMVSLKSTPGEVKLDIHL